MSESTRNGKNCTNTLDLDSSDVEYINLSSLRRHVTELALMHVRT